MKRLTKSLLIMLIVAQKQLTLFAQTPQVSALCICPDSFHRSASGRDSPKLIRYLT